MNDAVNQATASSCVPRQFEPLAIDDLYSQRCQAGGRRRAGQDPSEPGRPAAYAKEILDRLLHRN